MNQRDETEIFRTLLCSVFSSNLLLLLCDYKSCKRNSHHLEHGCRMVPMRIYIKLIILAAIQRNSVHEKCARTSAVDNDSEHFFFSFAYNLLHNYIALLYFMQMQTHRVTMDRKWARMDMHIIVGINRISGEFYESFGFFGVIKIQQALEWMKWIQCKSKSCKQYSVLCALKINGVFVVLHFIFFAIFS